jgi:hypothetical protein
MSLFFPHRGRLTQARARAGRIISSNPGRSNFLPALYSRDMPSFFPGAVNGIIATQCRKPVKKQFCSLLFFHFIPKGAAELVRPKNWARLFGIPELSGLSEAKSS